MGDARRRLWGQQVICDPAAASPHPIHGAKCSPILCRGIAFLAGDLCCRGLAFSCMCRLTMGKPSEMLDCLPRI